MKAQAKFRPGAGLLALLITFATLLSYLWVAGILLEAAALAVRVAEDVRRVREGLAPERPESIESMESVARSEGLEISASLPNPPRPPGPPSPPTPPGSPRTDWSGVGPPPIPPAVRRPPSD